VHVPGETLVSRVTEKLRFTCAPVPSGKSPRPKT
jgi:hypothetical protein